MGIKSSDLSEWIKYDTWEKQEKEEDVKSTGSKQTIKNYKYEYNWYVQGVKKNI